VNKKILILGLFFSGLLLIVSIMAVLQYDTTDDVYEIAIDKDGNEIIFNNSTIRTKISDDEINSKGILWIPVILFVLLTMVLACMIISEFC